MKSKGVELELLLNQIRPPVLGQVLEVTDIPSIYIQIKCLNWLARKLQKFLLRGHFVV